MQKTREDIFIMTLKDMWTIAKTEKSSGLSVVEVTYRGGQK